MDEANLFLEEKSPWWHLLVEISLLTPYVVVLTGIVFMAAVILLVVRTRLPGRVLIALGTVLAAAMLAQYVLFPFAHVGRGLAYSAIQQVVFAVVCVLLSFGFLRLVLGLSKSNTSNSVEPEVGDSP